MDHSLWLEISKHGEKISKIPKPDEEISQIPTHGEKISKIPKHSENICKIPKNGGMPYCQHILYNPPVALLFSMFITENFQVKLLPCEYNRQISANTKGGRWAKYFRWESQRENS